MAIQAEQTFINMSVKNLDKSRTFFEQIGFEFNENFSDNNAACMIINSQTFVMLLGEEFFQTFTKKSVADSTKMTEVIIALSADSREAVDELVNKAFAAGASPSGDQMDHGFMYGWSFQDLDGHLWEVAYMEEPELPLE
ncbi:VOC family protein [Planococcus lenghuensis]|uniref:Glyoxalase/bleomycin resistance/extradiol dioxygenase family protein n=1 Tax=Planococcus lenghuensis TaxID=2213202 RepID=A0A1Q2KWZ2_9BACL|nr:VOC family protein [Planococcus lenghuensis]AQQ52634.1 glyoxalase/bleomycin resistance/extradiol dioxygenase family protein [Planococcus lenghuensis]